LGYEVLLAIKNNLHKNDYTIWEIKTIASDNTIKREIHFLAFFGYITFLKSTPTHKGRYHLTSTGEAALYKYLHVRPNYTPSFAWLIAAGCLLLAFGLTVALNSKYL
jgi:hypothetical protein